MFKQVGEPSSSARFCSETDTIINADRCSRYGVVFGQNDAQAVVDAGVLPRVVELLR